jgi:hypothetical protein
VLAGGGVICGHQRGDANVRHAGEGIVPETAPVMERVLASFGGC